MSIEAAVALRWGILGCGRIAKQFADGLGHAPGATLVAVGSRDLGKAERFARETGAERAHGSYEALAADEEVEAIYVATPHPLHCEHTLLCLGRGKAVLCEKPFAVNRAEAERMVEAARGAGLFLMEAMWTRFFPAMVRLRELLKSGAIGEPRLLQADFGFRAGWSPESRLLSPALAGGALLDVGVYTVSLAHMVFGEPVSVAGEACIGETGVDEQSAAVLLHAGGALSVLSSAVRTSTPHEAVVNGTEGRIRIEAPWWKPSVLVLDRRGERERIEMPYPGNGYQYEALEVARCLAAGRRESVLMPLGESLEVMRTLDALRARWGLRYPME